VECDSGEKYTTSPRIIDHYIGGPVVAYCGELVEEKMRKAA
jgi:hypothetical protein